MITTCNTRSVIDADPDARLTIREVAALLGRHNDYVRKALFYTGVIPNEFDEADGTYRARRADVDAYLAGRLEVDPDPMFAELADYAEQIAAAKRLYDDLVERRNRAAVRWVDVEKQPVTRVAKAVGLSRDRTHTLLARTRAKLAEAAAKRAKK